MKVGSIGYATYQGLGILLKDFYDSGVITDVMTINHPRYPNQSWYKGPTTDLKKFNVDIFYDFMKSMDIMFFFETPFHPGAIHWCKSMGVKTILMPMYECTPKSLGLIDVVLNPSLLDQVHFPTGKTVTVPIPPRITWRQRTRARVFVHNAGHGGMNGRNGTRELLETMEFVKSPIKLVVRSQCYLGGWANTVRNDSRVSFEFGTVPFDELYKEGDVFIFPEKFNGLSLPLQEAKASGMLVMATDRFPTSEWTHTDCLISTRGEKLITNQIGITTLSSIVDPKDIAKTIDTWYDQDITQHSIDGRIYGEVNSWESLKGMYMQEIMSCFLGH